MQVHVKIGWVRLQRGVEIAGIDPELARAVVRLVASTGCVEVSYLAARLALSEPDTANAIEKLIAGGFVERSTAGLGLTIAGGALSMASFNKPIARSTAEKLMVQVIARAKAYDADDTKPFKIKVLRVFGS